ncbi:MAG: hypothetical protein Q4P31_05695 [Andreesenia angusta]|nr:hypothetical protein [Andreesenia angusta]
MFSYILFILASISIAIIIFLLSEKNERKQKVFKGKIRKSSPVKIEEVKDYIYLLYESNLVDFRRMIHFFVLKWIDEGILEAVLIDDKHQVYGFQIEKKPDDNLEKQLFNYFIASEDNGIIKRKNFTILNRRNRESILEFEEDIVSRSKSILLEKEFIRERRNRLIFTQKGKNLSKEFKGFREYLKKIKNYRKEISFSIENLDELMIFSGLFGLYDIVELMILNNRPSYFEESELDSKSLDTALVYSKLMQETIYPNMEGVG